MKAHELKLLADEANKNKDNPKVKEIYNCISNSIVIYAKQGLYSYNFYLSEFNANKSTLDEVVKLLSKDGLSVIFDSEITSWYSNTDWDEAIFINVSWM